MSSEASSPIRAATPTQEFEESVHLLTIFPEEVWLQILENVTYLQDYFRICASSNLLLSLFSLQRTRVLFPSVLQLLQNYLSNTFQDLVNLRPVCRYWNRTVNHFLQSSQNNRATWSSSNRVLEQSVQIRDFEQAQAFQNSFDSSHLISDNNPFLSRRITIFISPNQTDYSHYYLSLLELLRKYGAHVWHADLEVNDQVPNKLNCINNVRRILENLPFLRTLSLQFPHHERHTVLRDWLNIHRCLERSPMPTLKRLEMVKEVETPVPLLWSLLKNNPQVRVLDSSDALGSDNLGGLWRFDHLNLPNLQELVLPFQSPSAPLAGFYGATVNWPLTSLNCMVNRELNLVLGVMEKKFGTTLEKLRINSTTKNYFYSCDIRTFPNLRVMHLKLRDFITLDFLLSLSNTLEEFSLELTDEIPPSSEMRTKAIERRVVIKFFEFRHELYRSNIWMHFPKLKMLRFLCIRENERWNICTRNQWKDFLDAK